MSRSPRRPRSERGAATAELVMTLPLLLAVTVGLCWLLAVGVAQVRMVDAAREAARAVARGESEDVAVQWGRQVAPEGSTITIAHGDQVVVTATGRLAGPGGLFGFLPGVRLTAEAVAAAEPSG